jgi:CopG family nickel-responsive transcriptional regulator
MGTADDMQRITITIDDELTDEVDKFIASHGYAGRSEAMRDLVRAGLQQVQEQMGDSRHCMAALVYVYDHGARELARRLTERQHEHHDLTVSSLHVHLDHDTCMEVSVLRGETARVRELATGVTAERGVRHGRLVVVPVDIQRQEHAHDGEHAHVHEHIRVREGGG